MKSRWWATFLPVPKPNTSDPAPVLSEAWCAAAGVYPGAPVVLRLLREKVLPLVRWLEKHAGLKGYHFLIHDRTSGVPPEGGDGDYIHLMLEFWGQKPMRLIGKKITSAGFVMTRPVNMEGSGGFNIGILDGGAEAGRKLLGALSAWVLSYLESHKDGADPFALVQQTRQFTHFLSNMIQMKVS